MVSGSTKRIVVIKDIPSNLIEEAILILKSDPDAAVGSGTKNPAQKGEKKNNDYLLKEAEAVITNYIKDGKLQAITAKEPEKKVKGEKRKLFINLGVNLVLVAGISILILVLTKMI